MSCLYKLLFQVWWHTAQIARVERCQQDPSVSVSLSTPLWAHEDSSVDKAESPGRWVMSWTWTPWSAPQCLLSESKKSLLITWISVADSYAETDSCHSHQGRWGTGWDSEDRDSHRAAGCCSSFPLVHKPVVWPNKKIRQVNGVYYLSSTFANKWKLKASPCLCHCPAGWGCSRPLNRSRLDPLFPPSACTDSSLRSQRPHMGSGGSPCVHRIYKSVWIKTKAVATTSRNSVQNGVLNSAD